MCLLYTTSLIVWIQLFFSQDSETLAVHKCIREWNLLPQWCSMASGTIWQWSLGYFLVNINFVLWNHIFFVHTSFFDLHLHLPQDGKAGFLASVVFFGYPKRILAPWKDCKSQLLWMIHPRRLLSECSELLYTEVAGISCIHFCPHRGMELPYGEWTVAAELPS